MISFADLPLELVSQIWENLLYPEDIQSFAKVSRRTFATGKAAVERYTRWRAEYAIISNVGDNRNWSGSMLAPLLKEVLLHPYIGHYIKSLEVHHCAYDFDNFDSCRQAANSITVNKFPDYDENGLIYKVHHRGPAHTPFCADDLDLYHRAVLSDVAHSQSWYSKIKEGEEEPLLALLLQRLPNLRILVLNHFPDEDADASSLEELFTNAHGQKLLTKLESIKIGYQGNDRYDDGSTVLLYALARLPSVKHLEIKGRCMGKRSHAVSDSWTPGISPVENLALRDVEISLKDLATLIEGCKELKNFTYWKQVRAQDVFWLRTILLARARSSLLHLAIFELGNQDEYSHPGSFRDFLVLKYLVLDARMVVNAWTEDRDYIASGFPDRIEEIDLQEYEFGRDTELEEIVSAFINAKALRYGNLKKLGLRFRYCKDFQYHPFGASHCDDLIELCRVNGIELIL